MSYAQPKQYFAATQRAVANADAIEWEELPSLVSSLSQRRAPRGANDSAFMATTGFGATWDATMPAAFDPAPLSQPFREPLAGLSTREVNEPDVFRHFFGPNATAR
jgi:hypothetical protein